MYLVGHHIPNYLVSQTKAATESIDLLHNIVSVSLVNTVCVIVTCVHLTVAEVLVVAGCEGLDAVAVADEEVHHRYRQRMNWTHSLMPTMPRFVFIPEKCTRTLES